MLFRGNAEGEIRRALVRRGHIAAIIGLPANLFHGTGIPACIVVVDKQDAHARKGIFMIDASAGFMKDGPRNRLRERVHQRPAGVVGDLKEQAAIADVLSGMDAEIDALEAKQAKARAIKEGMMQELLTGRIRLVAPVDQTPRESVDLVQST